MPIYEYKCDSCGTVTELLQRMNDEPLKKCPKCSGHVEKIYSRSSFQLKGSGWYVTDYGKGTGGAAGMTKKAKSEESSSSSKSESSKGESSSSESRSESKSESKGDSKGDSKGESKSESKSKSKKTSSAKGGD